MTQGVGVLGLVIAIVFVFLGVSQVDALETGLESVTTGGFASFLNGISFFTLLLTIVVLVVAIGGFAMWAMRH